MWGRWIQQLVVENVAEVPNHALVKRSKPEKHLMDGLLWYLCSPQHHLDHFPRPLCHLRLPRQSFHRLSITAGNCLSRAGQDEGSQNQARSAKRKNEDRAVPLRMASLWIQERATHCCNTKQSKQHHVVGSVQSGSLPRLHQDLGNEKSCQHNDQQENLVGATVWVGDRNKSYQKRPHHRHGSPPPPVDPKSEHQKPEILEEFRVSRGHGRCPPVRPQTQREKTGPVEHNESDPDAKEGHMNPLAANNLRIRRHARLAVGMLVALER
mmetsp:Transcript_46659/g.123259  ORF Transcript_46659/g.123259 Transcript_46659/m.123259 type:complete len:267 (+) Transcript_46659:538-1338(+)